MTNDLNMTLRELRNLDIQKDLVIGEAIRRKHGWELRSNNRRHKGTINLSNVPEDFPRSNQLIVASLGEFDYDSEEYEASSFIGLLGNVNDVNMISICSAINNKINIIFSDQVINEVEDISDEILPTDRYDIRNLPLVTIDGDDSKDFDDAVFAEKTDLGWHIVVAIADVSHYVKYATDIDRTAAIRGNSVYFPDRVIPMLPEKLSNDLCSLKPNLDRYCMVANIWIDDSGKLLKWEFQKGIMNSKARLTYKEAQDIFEHHNHELFDTVIKPLYDVYDVLKNSRNARNTLDLEFPEFKIEFENNTVSAINVVERMDSHKLIEEFMILANIVAALELEGTETCIYRIHPEPSQDKIASLKLNLKELGIKIPRGKKFNKESLSKILKESINHPAYKSICQMIVKSQSQANYSPNNIGHFGLDLAHYAHFTSPIRRYSDLIVHRALVSKCGLPGEGLSKDQLSLLNLISQQCSDNERKAFLAERDAKNRMMLHFVKNTNQKVFKGIISNVSQYGLFVRILECVDGFIPFDKFLLYDYYEFNGTSLVGRNSYQKFSALDMINVKISEIDLLTGNLIFKMI